MLISCNKEDSLLSLPPSDVNSVEHPLNVTEALARNFHDQTKQLPEFPVFLRNSLLGSTATLVPKWSRATKTVIGNVVRYEMPLTGMMNYTSRMESYHSSLETQLFLVIEVNTKSYLMRTFVVTLIGVQLEGELSYSGSKSSFRGIMAISTLSGEFLKGFYYTPTGRIDVVFNRPMSGEKPLTRLRILGLNVTKGPGGGGSTHDDYCGTCHSVQPFYGSICLTCEYWNMDLPEIVVTPECPEHGRNCYTCFNVCPWHNKVNCFCQDPENPDRPPGGTTEGGNDGGGHAMDPHRYCQLCGEMGCSSGPNCPKYTEFPPFGGNGESSGNGGSEGHSGQIPQIPGIPFYFSDIKSRQRVSGVILKIMSTKAGGVLVNQFTDWRVFIEYASSSDYVASYDSAKKALLWGDRANEAAIFHELIHALQHKVGINYVSNRMNREVEAFVGMYMYADAIEQMELLQGGWEDWRDIISPYVANPTEANYLNVIEFIKTFDPVYLDFTENPQYRNTNNINFLFN